MDKSDRLVDVRVIDSRDQGSLSFLDEMLLDSTDALDVLNVFVEFGVDSHVLGPDCKALLVLVFVSDTDNKGNA
jgi:hypothetical protein